MYKFIIGLFLSVFTLNTLAEQPQDCSEPSNTINYIPMGVITEYCFKEPVKHIYSPSSSGINIKFGTKSVILTAMRSGFFSNLIVEFKNGINKEYNLITLVQPEVEQVVLIDTKTPDNETLVNIINTSTPPVSPSNYKKNEGDYSLQNKIENKIKTCLSEKDKGVCIDEFNEELELAIIASMAIPTVSSISFTDLAPYDEILADLMLKYDLLIEASLLKDLSVKTETKKHMEMLRQVGIDTEKCLNSLKDGEDKQVCIDRVETKYINN